MTNVTQFYDICHRLVTMQTRLLVLHYREKGVGMPRKSLSELNSVSVRTVLQLRPNERVALNALVQATGDFPARVVGTLVLRAAQALADGATWGGVLTAMEAAWELGAAWEYYDHLVAMVEAQGASPTAESSTSVTGDATDRPTDRPCGGGYA